MKWDQKDRPIADAADTVKQVAVKVLAMLDELQKGWLWQLLTRQQRQNSKVSEDQ